jgi:lysozyme
MRAWWLWLLVLWLGSALAWAEETPPILFPDFNAKSYPSNWDQVEEALGEHKLVAARAIRENNLVDDQFYAMARECQARHILLIAYQFGVFGDGAAQFDTFEARVPWRPGLIYCLDFEPPGAHPTMVASQAEAWVHRAHQRGYPVVGYRGSRDPHYPDFGADLTWIARYGREPAVPNAMWQFTDGQKGPRPHVFPGVGACDVSIVRVPFRELERAAGIFP